jgi:hypothetical protein
VVQCDPVLEAVRPTCVLGDVAADRAGGLAGWIGRVMQPVRRDGARERHVHDAWLDHGETFHRIDRQNARQAIESDEHHVIGERAA